MTVIYSSQTYVHVYKKNLKVFIFNDLNNRHFLYTFKIISNNKT